MKNIKHTSLLYLGLYFDIKTVTEHGPIACAYFQWLLATVFFHENYISLVLSKVTYFVYLKQIFLNKKGIKI